MHCLKKHSTQIAFLETRISATDHIIRLIECEFRCNICGNVYSKYDEMKRHFRNNHVNCMFGAGIVEQFLVIYSDNPRMPVGSKGNVSNRCECGDLFFCDEHEERFLGNTARIIHHMNAHQLLDSSHPFEIRITRTFFKYDSKQQFEEEEKPHRTYVFECSGCSKIHESIENASEHWLESNVLGGESIPCAKGFMARKLMACSVCRVVSTFHRIDQQHECAEKVPINALNPKICAFCNRRKGEEVFLFLMIIIFPICILQFFF